MSRSPSLTIDSDTSCWGRGVNNWDIYINESWATIQGKLTPQFNHISEKLFTSMSQSPSWTIDYDTGCWGIKGGNHLGYLHQWVVTNIIFKPLIKTEKRKRQLWKKRMEIFVQSIDPGVWNAIIKLHFVPTKYVNGELIPKEWDEMRDDEKRKVFD